MEFEGLVTCTCAEGAHADEVTARGGNRPAQRVHYNYLGRCGSRSAPTIRKLSFFRPEERNLILSHLEQWGGLKGLPKPEDEDG